MPVLLSQDVYDRVYRQLRGENALAVLESGLFELVDFQGTVVNVKKLTAQVADLEARVAGDVGSDNRHDEVPTFLLNQQMPKWLKKLIDDWADQEKKKSTKQQPRTVHAA